MNRKAKLLVGAESLQMQSFGGISRVIREILPVLKESGYFETICLYRASENPLSESTRNLASCVTGLWVREDRRPFRARCWLNKTVLRNWNQWRFTHADADIYLSTYYSPPPRSVPSVCFVYDMTYERYPECFPIQDVSRTLELKRAAVMQSARLVCISKTTKLDLVQFYGVDADRCDVVYLGGGEERAAAYAPLAKDLSAPLKILYVGCWIAKYKNFSFLLSALDVFRQHSGLPLELNVVSKRGSCEAHQQHAKLIRSPVLYHENISDTNLTQLYRECDVFVYPSLWEGFGIPVVEALASGCPVLCSDIPVFHEVGGCAVNYFNPHDIDSFCVAMNSAIKSGRNLETVKKRTEQAALFTWEKCAHSILKSIQKAVQ